MRLLILLLIFGALAGATYYFKQQKLVEAQAAREAILVKKNQELEAAFAELKQQSIPDPKAEVAVVEDTEDTEYAAVEIAHTTDFKPGEEMQELVSNDGRRIQAKVIGVSSDRVTVFRPDVYKQFTFPTSALDGDSQQLLADWQRYQESPEDFKSRVMVPVSEKSKVPKELEGINWNEMFKY